MGAIVHPFFEDERLVGYVIPEVQKGGYGFSEGSP